MCNNFYFKVLSMVKTEIFRHGMVETYTRWIHHGEPFEVGSNSNTNQPHSPFENEIEVIDTNIPDMLDDLGRATAGSFPSTDGATTNNPSLANLSGNLTRLIKDVNCPLYPGCKKFSKLSFVMKMMNNKLLTNSSDKAFNLNFELAIQGCFTKWGHTSNFIL
ncbi:unnamed protein product [Linum trigynum]|uniref:Transposase-associated domain-containing protein n=1 Tax=Linum trigynum TaxID=586398 RepID=A0AAV2EAW6_9ROSI